MSFFEYYLFLSPCIMHLKPLNDMLLWRCWIEKMFCFFRILPAAWRWVEVKQAYAASQRPGDARYSCITMPIIAGENVFVFKIRIGMN